MFHGFRNLLFALHCCALRVIKDVFEFIRLVICGSAIVVRAAATAFKYDLAEWAAASQPSLHQTPSCIESNSLLESNSMLRDLQFGFGQQSRVWINS